MLNVRGFWLRRVDEQLAPAQISVGSRNQAVKSKEANSTERAFGENKCFSFVCGVPNTMLDCYPTSVIFGLNKLS